MNEVLLCENKQWAKPLKFFTVCTIIGLVLSLCMFFFAFLPMVFSDMEDGDDYGDYYDDYYDDYYGGSYGGYYDDYYDDYYGGYYDDGVDFSEAWGYNDDFLWYCLIPFGTFLIIGIYYALIIKYTRLYVTNKRVYGTRIFGRRADIPLDKIVSVSRGFFFGKINIATPSFRALHFNWIRNYKEMHRVICELLNNRQDNCTAAPGYISEDTQEPSSPSANTGHKIYATMSNSTSSNPVFNTGYTGSTEN